MDKVLDTLAPYKWYLLVAFIVGSLLIMYLGAK
jgi:hypothetical protein